MDDDADVIGHLLVRIYEIHEVIIATTGGLPGLRDGALLHAAVARPFTTFAGQELYPTPFDKAAALLHSLMKSYPFVEGTKRTALAAALFVLQVYGYAVPARLPVEAVVAFCSDIAEENRRQATDPTHPAQTIADIAAWLRTLLGQPAGPTLHPHGAG